VPERIILLVLVGVLTVCALASGVGQEPAGDTIRLRVERGDTLWQIAADHRLDGLTTEQTVGVIARLNHLEGQTLAEGSEIEVPQTSAQARIDLASK
jgi:Tfp pilus assembly protein FimV